MDNSKLYYIILRKSVAGGISLVVMLIALVVASAISITGIKSLTYIKKHEIALQSFLLRESNLFEAQIFINKHLAISKIDSISIGKDSLQWEGYSYLYKAGDNNGTMDFSTDTKHCKLEIIHSTLYYNGAMLLPHATMLKSYIYKQNNITILEYSLCDIHHCISDFIPLSDSEIDI